MAQAAYENPMMMRGGGAGAGAGLSPSDAAGGGGDGGGGGGGGRPSLAAAARRRYQKPTVEAALQYKLLLHPSFTPAGAPAGTRAFFSLREARTGRYCGARLGKCDPCCEGNSSDFAEFGSGVTVFFKGSKWASRRAAPRRTATSRARLD